MSRLLRVREMLCVVLASSASLAGPTPSWFAPPVAGVGRDVVLERLLGYERDLLSAPDAEARHEVSVDLAELGFELLKAHEPRGTIYIKLAGIGLYNDGTPHALEHAWEIYNRLSVVATQDRDVADALEMLAKVASRAGNSVGAAQGYERWLAFVTAGGDLRGDSGDRFGTTAVEYSVLLDEMNRPDESAAVLGLLTGPYRDAVSPNEAQVALAWRARKLARAGRRDDALRLWNELLDGWPELGVEDNKRVSWLMERARVIDPTGQSDAYADELLAIWSDRRFVGSIQHLRAGTELLRTHERREEYALGASLGAEVSLEALAEESRLSRLDTTPKPSVFGFRALQRTILLQTMRLGELAEDWPTAVWAADAYSQRFDTDANRYGADKDRRFRLSLEAARAQPASSESP